MMEELLYWIGQSLGVVAVILGFLSYQVRTRKKLMLLQTATTLVFVLHYLLIGAMSGMALNAVGLLRNIVYSNREKKFFSGRFWPIAFAVIMGFMGLLSWQGWYSIFVVVGLVINTLALALPDPQKIRKSILITSPLVLTYDAFALSVGGIIYESVAILSSLVGILRFRKQKAK